MSLVSSLTLLPSLTLLSLLSTSDDGGHAEEGIGLNRRCAGDGHEHVLDVDVVPLGPIVPPATEAVGDGEGDHSVDRAANELPCTTSCSSTSQSPMNCSKPDQTPPLLVQQSSGVKENPSSSKHSSQ